MTEQELNKRITEILKVSEKMRGCVRPRVDVGLAGNTGAYKGSDTMIDFCFLFNTADMRQT